MLEKAKGNLQKLLDKFSKEVETGRIQTYNEEAAKISFIQPLLKDVLGWDVQDINEVSPEEKTSKGRVDYGLKIDGKIKIFVEAKPPKADLNKYIEQAIRYGYNKKGVPFVLLTDFEDIKLFDVTIKPDEKNPFKGLKIDLNWQNYLKEFDKLWLLSKESVKNGELEKLLLLKPKDRLPVDEAILDDLKKWRELLAKNIYKKNSEIFNSCDREKDASYLKEITQKILDRIIFMRSCEDRNLIHRRPLKEIFEERSDKIDINAMIFLKEEFYHYNLSFNSDLFRQKEWEEKLWIDFKVMKEIILGTYNPYQFDVIPVEVLGNIYEQFLGYSIKLTEHFVKYELKPELRKAGGVYYTPEYIVEYIVQNTVCKLLKELPPNKIKKLRILDPACGSGSFLIKAYEEMLNYYRNEKRKKKEIEKNKLPLKIENIEEPLTIQEKSKILKDHIFGVDIDEQAVEITKLSLMIKMLEGEEGIIPGRAILPMLDGNIKCGNSLISGDTLELKKYFGDEWYKFKPFNWDEEFKEIMVKEGGFGVIIGNPPYIFARDEGFKSDEKDYFYNKYKLAQYQLNTYIMFIERACSLLSKDGILGFIIPNNWLTIDTTSLFRKFIVEKTKNTVIVNIYDKVFGSANVDCAILLFKMKGSSIFSFYEIKDSNIIKIADEKSDFFKESNYIINYDIIRNKNKIKLLNKIEIAGKTLNNFAIVKAGINAYEVGKGTPKQTEQMKNNRVYHSNVKIDDTYFKYINGKDVQRYFLNWNNKYIKYGKNLAAPRTFDLFNGERLLIRQIPSKLPYCILTAYIDKTIINDRNSMILKNRSAKYNIRYFLALINSKLISFWFYYKFGKLQRKTFPQFKVKELRIFPIKQIDFYNKSEKQIHDDLVSLVDIMLDLNKKIQTAKGSEKRQIQKQIEKTDKEIDEIVYKLYGITDEERKIIEEEA